VAVSLIPSYILKAGRAEKHLHDLKLAIAKWADTHPYEVRTTRYRKRDAHHLRFTSSPPPEISVIAADIAYNLQSGLDHLMAALVPAADRDSVYFPIYFQGAWEDPLPGEDVERTKARRRWKSNTAKVRPDAVAILKSLQPPDDGGKGGQTINTFRAIHLIANKDKHQQLPVVFSALRSARLMYRDAQGNRHIGPTDTGIPAIDMAVCKDVAELIFPMGAVDVQIGGAPVVAIEISPEAGNVEIPYVFDLALTAYRERAVEPLAPHIHRGK
jgi:hypothetical protein